MNFRKIKKKFFGFSQCFGVIQKVRADSAPPPALKQHPGGPPYQGRLFLREMFLISICFFALLSMTKSPLHLFVLTQNRVRLGLLTSKKEDGPQPFWTILYCSTSTYLILHLSICNNNQDVVHVPALHNVPHCTFNYRSKTCWTTQRYSPRICLLFYTRKKNTC